MALRSLISTFRRPNVARAIGLLCVVGAAVLAPMRRAQRDAAVRRLQREAWADFRGASHELEPPFADLRADLHL